MALTRFVGRPGVLTRSMLDDLPDRIRQMFEGNLSVEPFAEPLGWMPPMEIVEKEDTLVVTAELPGMAAKDVDVSIDDDVLTIAGEKKEEKKEEDPKAKYHMWERRYGSFRRSFTLPQTVDGGKIAAKFTDGVLTVTLPKTTKAKALGRKIPVTNGK